VAELAFKHVDAVPLSLSARRRAGPASEPLVRELPELFPAEPRVDVVAGADVPGHDVAADFGVRQSGERLASLPARRVDIDQQPPLALAVSGARYSGPGLGAVLGARRFVRRRSLLVP